MREYETEAMKARLEMEERRRQLEVNAERMRQKSLEKKKEMEKDYAKLAKQML